MTLALARRLEVRGTLVCRSALSVGAWDESPLADTAVARDGSGRFVVPGTSLTGAIRSWYARCHGEDAAREVFGYLDDSRKDRSGPETVASLVRVDDAPLVNRPPDDARPEDATPKVRVRDGVRIDPRTGSAMHGFLFTREVLPAGTRFAFRLTADVPPAGTSRGHVDVAAAVRAVAGALAHGAVDLGGRTTQGLGRVELQDVTISESDLGSRDGLLAWLRDGPQLVSFTPPALGGSGRLGIEIIWKPRYAVLVRDSEAGTAVDALPLTARDADGTVRLLIPGSSIKGALRAHAERIVRTLREQDADRTAEREVLPAVAALFGTGPGTAGQVLPAGYRGTLRIEDCHSAGHVSGKDWDAVTASLQGQDPPSAPASTDPFERRRQADEDRRRKRSALTDELRRALPADMRLRVADHVAVDRWTGGPASGRLFSVLEPMGTAWEPIRLSVDTHPRPTPNDSWPEEDLALLHEDLQIALLLLVLRDLAEDMIPIGSGTTRGLGHLSVQKITFSGDGVTGPWEDLAGRTLADVLAAPPPKVAAALTTWQRHQALQPVQGGDSRD
jgi:CRISPR/Cas system CSM-associated protein Csm3 (group 7 of RAMP superfamily)